MTNYCNSNCTYCAHAVSKKGEIKDEIPFNVIERTLRDAKTLGCTALAINGGEPLLISNVERIVKTTVDNEIVPVLMTNGLLLPQKWESLGDAGLRFIIISFDSLNRETYEKQRGVSFDRAMAGIEAALNLRKKFGDGVKIFISATLTENNFDDMAALIRFTTERGIKIQFSPLHDYLGEAGKTAKVDENQVNQMVDSLLKMKQDGFLIASSTEFIRHFKDFFCHGKRVPDGYHCKMGCANLCIDAYMNVRACWSKRFRAVGNLGNQSLIDIWNSALMRENRKRMYNMDCEGCWYMCTEITMAVNGQTGG